MARHRPLDGVSIKVHAGEIVGIAGVEGNGQTELIDAIVGLVAGDRDGDRSTAATSAKLSTLARRTAGIGLIPEDRQRDGMVLAMPLWENVLLGHQASPQFTDRGLIDRDACRRRGRRGRQRLRRAHAEHRRARRSRCRAATSRS